MVMNCPRVSFALAEVLCCDVVGDVLAARKVTASAYQAEAATSEKQAYCSLWHTWRSGR